MFHLFKNRAEAGSDLATALSKYAGKPDTLILALPRGGVPVACEAAKALSLPMDVWLVRKVGVPGHEELALGAIDLNGAFHVNPEVAVAISIPQSLINHLIEKERVELARRNKLYRQERPAPSLDGKTVIVIDDGLATGATMRAAIESLRQTGVRHIVAAAPVGSRSTCEKLLSVADEVVCPHIPENFYGVGQWYDDFSQTSDQEVQSLLLACRESPENFNSVRGH